MAKGIVVNPRYDHYQNLPKRDMLINPLMDVPIHLKEDSEILEFYKLTNEHFSPELAVKYIFNFNLYPFQMSMLRAMLMHKFPMLLMSRGGSKTTLLAIYSLLHAYLFPESKIVIISGSFRQAKYVFDNIKSIYDKAPLLRKLCSGVPTFLQDRCKMTLNGSTIVALPLSGDKIRGERGHVIIADEIDAINPEIFDVVIRGFATTEASPWEKTRQMLLEKANKKDQLMGEMLGLGNKIIVSGTAGYKNGSFYRIYKHYVSIIRNRLSGNAKEYEDILGAEFDDDQELDYRDYCIVRYAYNQLPQGLLDKKIIASSRSQMPRQIFDMEYRAIFADDSLGFFRAKDINAATSKYPNGFHVSTKGRANRRYVMGVDPARSIDRFAISIIELGTPNKVVYCWTCQGQKYSYGAKKIRELLRCFKVEGIAMDPGGGGTAIEELLNSGDIMENQDRKICRYDEPPDPDSDNILYMYDFTIKWIDEANTSLQKNIEDKTLMFPVSVADDESATKEDIIYEIKELQKELCSIEVTSTKTGKRHFDLKPIIAGTTGDVIRHKDRYSSLLLANYLITAINLGENSSKQKAKKAYESLLGGYIEEFS